MIDIKTFQVNMLQENCYVVSDDTKEAVVIDCGAYYNSERQAIVDYLRNNNFALKHLLCTHGHFDHVFGNDTIYDAFGLKPEIHREDYFLVEDIGRQFFDMLGENYNHPTPPVGTLLSDGDSIDFGHHRLRVIHTPGHSPGSVIFHCEEENVAFSGDTLFRMSVGRTDLNGGSWNQLADSLRQKVALLPDNTIVYPGHGPQTVIREEKQMNPYFWSSPLSSC